jgi:HPt (histidine-containing phosphotransfer) domain-containing protein
MNKLIDQSVLDNYELLDTGWPVLQELHKYFVKNVPDRLAESHDYLAKGDFKNLKESLHALKNSFLNVGALTVAEQCQSLEDNLNQFSFKVSDEHHKKIELQYFEVRRELEIMIEMSRKN